MNAETRRWLGWFSFRYANVMQMSGRIIRVFLLLLLLLESILPELFRRSRVVKDSWGCSADSGRGGDSLEILDGFWGIEQHSWRNEILSSYLANTARVLFVEFFRILCDPEGFFRDYSAALLRILWWWEGGGEGDSQGFFRATFDWHRFFGYESIVLRRSRDLGKCRDVTTSQYRSSRYVTWRPGRPIGFHVPVKHFNAGRLSQRFDRSGLKIEDIWKKNFVEDVAGHILNIKFFRFECVIELIRLALWSAFSTLWLTATKTFVLTLLLRRCRLTQKNYQQRKWKIWKKNFVKDVLNCVFTYFPGSIELI